MKNAASRDYCFSLAKEIDSKIVPQVTMINTIRKQWCKVDQKGDSWRLHSNTNKNIFNENQQRQQSTTSRDPKRMLFMRVTNHVGSEKTIFLNRERWDNDGLSMRVLKRVGAVEDLRVAGCEESPPLKRSDGLEDLRVVGYEGRIAALKRAGGLRDLRFVDYETPALKRTAALEDLRRVGASAAWWERVARLFRQTSVGRSQIERRQ